MRARFTKSICKVLGLTFCLCLQASRAEGPQPSVADTAQATTRLTSATKAHVIGKASWYGRYFHGRPTASGEPYDMYALTAAHLTLPLGTYVRVTNLRNGRSAVVRINDRGPYIAGRIIDLSYGAARLLDMENEGIQSVRLEVVHPQTVAMTAKAPGERILPSNF